MNTSDPPLESPLEDVPFELKKLDRIIRKDVHQFLQAKSAMPELLIADFVNFMEQEVERIKTRLSLAAYSYEEEKFKKYVQFHQRSLLHLSGALLRYVESPDHLYGKPEGSEMISYLIYKTLQELLAFIERYHTEYYDPDAWLPYNYRLIRVHDMRTNVVEIDSKLAAQNISPHFRQMVLRPFYEFVNDEGHNAKYRDVIYLDELRKQLKDFERADDLNLAWVLLHLNYNSKDFYYYWLNLFEQIKTSCETTIECIEQLYGYHKEISQAHTWSTLSLDATKPKLKDLLLQWLEKEIAFQKKRRKLLRDTEPDGEPANESEGSFALKFDLSIAQVAYFLSVLVRMKVIQNEKITQLLHFIYRVTRTTKKEKLSYEYFKGKYYKSESGARAGVSNLLERMLAFIKADQGKP